MAIADPDLILRLAKAVSDIYGEGATRMLEVVARRLADGIDRPGWAELKLLEQVDLRNEAQLIVDSMDVLGPEAIKAAIVEGARSGASTAAGEIGAAFARTNRQAVTALAAQTVAPAAQDAATLLGSMHLQLLRSTQDIYRSVIAEASSGVVTGTETRLGVAQRALNRFAQHGITGFVDQSGRNWEIQSYVEMTTRTTTGRAMVEGRLGVYQADGRRFVIVSDSPQECKLCRPWEGKILALNAGDVGQDTGDGRRAVASVAQATGQGLFHQNCRHDLRPYIPGITPRTGHTADPAGDVARQQQRRLERGVRQWKRVQASAMDDDARAKATAHVQQWQGALKTHLSDNPTLTPKPGRTSIRAAR